MVKKNYYLFDCKKFVLGRMAGKVAFLLAGKHRPSYAPNIEGNDFAVVVNSDEIKVTGRKKENKIYHSFSGYPSGVSSRNLKTALQKDSRRVIFDAVYGMLPKNKLRKKMMKRLLIFRDQNHDIKSDIIDINT